jgi:hypothetical protein
LWTPAEIVATPGTRKSNGGTWPCPARTSHGSEAADARVGVEMDSAAAAIAASAGMSSTVPKG